MPCCTGRFEHAPNNRKPVAEASQFNPVRCATPPEPCHALCRVGVLSRSLPRSPRSQRCDKAKGLFMKS